MLSEPSSVIAILSSMSVDLLVIDKDISDGPSLLTSVLATPNVPKVVTIRGTLPDGHKIDDTRILHVAPDTSDHTWFESITNDVSPYQEKPAKGKILIVDDVVELLDMYETMFQLKGYEVQTAKN